MPSLTIKIHKSEEEAQIENGPSECMREMCIHLTVNSSVKRIKGVDGIISPIVIDKPRNVRAFGHAVDTPRLNKAEDVLSS